ncbi:MAG: alpha-2-macroglobulin family protein, partial [Bacteroidota bacterium]
LFQANLQQSLQEEADNKTIAEWQQEINTAAEPSKSILASILAEKYYYYFQQHRYQLYDRTKTIDFKKDDIATWGPDDFHEKISFLYLASLKDEKILQQTKLDAFDPIILKGNARYLRPTLYDLLANRALEYFKTGEQDITRAAYAFEVNDGAYFSPATDFIKLTIATKDSSSLYHKALLIYQKLLAFHLNDEKPGAFIDADIQRLQFVHQHAVMEDKNKLYEKALGSIIDKFKTEPAAVQAFYLTAQLHAGKASLYDPLKYEDSDLNNPKDEYIIAAAICKQALQQKDESEGKTNCYNLLKQIEKKELNIATEKVNVPQQAFRSLISYRNFTKLYFRLVLMSDDLTKKLTNRYDDAYWKDLIALTPMRSWDQSLPATNDYQKHSAEIKVDALPVGQYILLGSTNADFSFNNNPLAVQYFYVSGISYINNSNEYFMLNRESGKPLAGASVQTWWSEYDYNTRTNKKIKGEKLNADKNGYLHLAKKATNRQGNMQLEITSENDKLFMDDGQYVYYREENEDNNAANATQYEKDNGRVFFFTDRSIYRPGQTVYFKGIAITKDFTSRKNKIYSGVSSKIFLRNANGEDVDSIQLKTNEYGSYNGKFVLPQGLLNGEFTLIDEEIDGNVSFSVEEYKRPKFSVDYEKIKGTYKINDSITITGFAKAYAGNNIDGAQVKFRVQRVARFIYPWLYWKRGYPNTSNMEISTGAIVTDADGKFKITFKAIPDLSVSKDLEPIFDYKITADVTDLNGETRSGETTVPVSYKALQLKINLPAILPADSLQNISISTQNLHGEFEPAQVKLVISKLRSPDRLIRKRYWAKPDQFVLNKDEFIKNFPNDEYNNESNYNSWPVEKAAFTKTDSSHTNSKFTILNSQFLQGWYKVEATAIDKYGAAVTDVQYIQLYDEKSKSVAAATYTWSAQKNNVVEPGEQSTITIGSAAADIFLIQAIDKKQTAAPVYNFINLTGKQTFSFPATEADRGGFGVVHFFVKNNRFYSLSNEVSVPWTNKDLQISYETFRDKTLPGSEEKWKLKISGYKNEKIAAEMLASMYDASLDQFKPHSWSVPAIWETYYGNITWVGQNCFNQVQSQERYWNEGTKYFEKSYDNLNTMMNGNMRFGNMNVRIRGIQSDAKPEESFSAAAPMQMKAMNASAKKGQPSVQQIPNWQNDPTGATMKDSEITGDDVSIRDNVKNTAPEIPVQIRKNFNETAFFLPDLKTDSAGNISFGFTIPEALTKWKFQSLAHTKDLAFGYSSNSVVTQKPLMVQPNAPRFMREGDKMELSAKVVNLTDKELTGTVELDLFNTATNEPVDGWFVNMYPTQYFT